jgi:SAM-dependent methyltransferase
MTRLARKLRSALKRILPGSWVLWLTRWRYRLKRRRNFGRAPAPARTRENWEGDLPSETSFWETYVESSEFKARLGVGRPFSPEPSQNLLYDLLSEVSPPLGKAFRVLDVGAGPATPLGTESPGGPVEVVAVDPLAERYDEILARKGMVPPIRTLRGEAEKLTDQFPEGSFDIVYSSNALDHSYEPMTAIRNMTLLCKPGGIVFLRHFENEAERENFYGLHKWNFFRRGRDMIIANRTEEISVAKMLSGLATVECTTRLESWGIVHAVIRRLKGAPPQT